MASFNQLTVLGNTTRDPQLKNLPGGSSLVEFGMATNRKYKTSSGEEREDVCFIDAKAWGKAAEIINQYVRKGDLLFCTGRLAYETWEDKQTGQKRSKHVLIVENFQLMPRRDGDGGGNGGGSSGKPAGQSKRPAQQQQAPEPFDESDIPF